MSSRHGFSLIEMLVVVVLLGLVVLIGYPKVRSGLLKNDVRAARTTVINLFSLARTTAMQSSRATRLKVNGNSVYVMASPRRKPGGGISANTDTVAVQDLNASYKVALTWPIGVDSILFHPTGLGGGFNTAGITIRLTRSGYSDSITVDGFGRVRK